MHALYACVTMCVVCAGSFTSSFSWMAAYSRPIDAATLLMPDDWDEAALPDGRCEPRAWQVRSRALDPAHVISDVVPQPA